MMIGLALSPCVKSGGAAVLDITTLNLTLCLRGDYAAAPWVGTASAGTSGTHDGATDAADPTVGAALSGYDSARFAAGQKLKNAAIGSEFISTTAYRVFGWIYPTARSASGGTATPYSDRAIISEAGGNWGITFTNDGVSVFHHDGAYKVASAACGINGWHFFDVVYDGVNLTVTVDGAAGTPVAASALGALGSILRIGTNWAAAASFEGDMEELDTAQSALAATTHAAIKAYGNARYGLTL